MRFSRKVTPTPREDWRDFGNIANEDGTRSYCNPHFAEVSRGHRPGSLRQSQRAGARLVGTRIRYFNSVLVVSHHRLVIYNFNQLHHAPVFVGQNVAMVHELAGEIGKVRPHLEIAGDNFVWIIWVLLA